MYIMMIQAEGNFRKASTDAAINFFWRLIIKRHVCDAKGYFWGAIMHMHLMHSCTVCM